MSHDSCALKSIHYACNCIGRLRTIITLHHLLYTLSQLHSILHLLQGRLLGAGSQRCMQQNDVQ